MPADIDKAETLTSSAAARKTHVASPPARRERRRIRDTLAIPAYRRLWSIGALITTVRWLEMLALGFFVFELTQNEFLTALVFTLRMAPMLLFGIVTGFIADHVLRKVLLLSSLAASGAISGLMGLLVLSGRVEFWHIAVATFLAGIFWAFDMPVRRPLVAEAVGTDKVGVAMGVESTTMQATRMVGPLLGGVFVASIGMQGVYFIGAALQAIALVIALRVATSGMKSDLGRVKVFANLREGFRYVRSSRLIIATLAVTMFVNLWGFSYSSQLPVIAKVELGVGAVALGILGSMEGLGGFLGALAISAWATPRTYTRIYLYGSFLFIGAVLLFALSKWYPLSVAILFAGGFGMAAFGSMQSTLMLTSTAPEMRGRIMGVLVVCIGAGPIGSLHVGLLAGLFGAPFALIVIALEGLAALTLATALWPELRRGIPPRPAPITVTALNPAS
ncbi:MAG: MFS transporter [Chloroflexi bacterium]|nr:MFS transporter [Chloroflexota bacterium]